MASSTAFLAVCVAMAVVGLSSACTYSCPSGFTVVEDGTTVCGYACIRGYNFACLGKLRNPYQCGGTTGIPCPAIACTNSYSAAFSGPTGCARASSAVAAVATSASVVASASLTYVNEVDFCQACAAPELNAELAATAYAKAVATTLIQYNAHVCTCCTGNTLAYTAISASVQAVAHSYAEAFSQAVISLSCNGQLLAGASSYLAAVAEDTQLAIDTVYKSYVSVKGKTCTSTGLQVQMQQAVAKAVACTFLQLYAAYDVANKVSSAYSCGATVALAGPDWNAGACPITYCPVL